MRSVQSVGECRTIHPHGGPTILGAGIVAGLLGFTTLESIPIVLVLVAVMVAPVAAGLQMWLNTLD